MQPAKKYMHINITISAAHGQYFYLKFYFFLPLRPILFIIYTLILELESRM